MILIKRCSLTRVKLITLYKDDKNYTDIHFKQAELLSMQ